jgi:hypothetical protein
MCKHFVILVLLLVAGLGSSAVSAAPPTFAVTFSPATISPGGFSTMTYTIDNSAENTPIESLVFTNVLPTGVTIAISKPSQLRCNRFVVATVGSGSVSFSGELEANSICTVQVNVTSNSPGAVVNTTSVLATVDGTVNAASATLTVDGSTGAVSSMAFSPAMMRPGEVSRLTYTLTRLGTGSATFQVLNIFPLGMTIAQFPNAEIVSCTSNNLNLVPGADFVFFSVSVSMGDVCTVSVNVTTSRIGTYFNEAGLGSADVIAELRVTNNFAHAIFPTSSTPGSSVPLTFTINNFDRINAATDITFTNNLNATLAGLEATVLPADDFCGSGSTLTGSTTLTLANANLAAEASCTFEVTVLIPATAAHGLYTNTSSIINLTLASATTKPAITNSLYINKAPIVTATYLDSPTSAGQDVTQRFVITNIDRPAVSAISFIADSNAQLGSLLVKTLPANGTCGGDSSFFTFNDNNVPQIGVDNASLAAGDECTFDVVLTVPADVGPGSYAFTTGNIRAVVLATTVYGVAATDNLIVVAAPALRMSFAADTLAPGTTTTVEFTLINSESATSDATSVGFTVDLDAALSGMVSTTTAQNDICGFGSRFSGTSTLTLSGALLSPGTSCTFSVTVQIPSTAPQGPVTVVSSVVSASTSGLAVTHAASSRRVIVTGLSMSKAFLSNPTLPGLTNTIRYTITNAASVPAATGIGFTDSLGSVLTDLAATELPTNGFCGTGSTLTGSTTLVLANANLAAGTSCTFDVVVLVPTSANSNNYASPTSNISATVAGLNTSSFGASGLLIVEELTLLLTTAVANPTAANPIPVNVYFSRAVINFEIADLVVENGSASNFAGMGNAYSVDITPSASGAVLVDVLGSVANDAVYPTVVNPAASQLSITYDATLVSLVDRPNTLPTANAGVNQTVASGATVTLDGSASNDLEGAVSYSWVQSSGSAVTLSGATVANPTFSAALGDAVLEFTLTVTDVDGATATDSVTVTLTNIAPLITIEGSMTFTLNVGEVFSDPGALAFDNEDGDLSSIVITISDVDNTIAGNYQVEYRVTDSGGLTSTVTRTVTVIQPLSSGAIRFAAGQVIELPVIGTALTAPNGDALLVPATATAASINVTVVMPGASGFMTVWPCGVARPFVSNLNYIAGDIVPNGVIAPIGSNGKVCFYSLSDTDLVVDVAGWFEGDAFVGATPFRLRDTRETSRVTPAEVLVLQVADIAASTADGAATVIPASVGAVALNVTVVNPDSAGFVTVYACGTRPLASSVNYTAGQIVPNGVIAPVSANGEVCIYSLVPTDVVVDLSGWFPGEAFTAATPLRLVDTRDGTGGQQGKLTPAGQLTVSVHGQTLSVADNSAQVPLFATAAALNVTIVNPEGSGFATVWPCSAARPLASNLNFVSGQVVANNVIAPIGDQGNVCFYTSTPSDIIVDIAGYFSGDAVNQFVGSTPKRYIDTRSGLGPAPN